MVFDKNNGPLVVIFPAIIWRAENCDYRWECLVSAPTMHFVAVDLDLVCANDGDEVVLAKNLFDWIQSEFKRTLSRFVLYKSLLSGLVIT